MKVYEIQVTTDNAGDGATTLIMAHGMPQLLYAVQWVDGDFADGVDAVLSCTGGAGVKRTLLTLTDANVDAVYYPRELEDDNAGVAAATYTLPLVEGLLELVVSDGGDTKTGGCRLYTIEV